MSRRSPLIRLRDSLQRESPLPTRTRIIWIILGVLLLAGPFASHLHKSHNPDRPHGDWYSIYSIGRYSIETGDLEADEAEPIVRTQRYPPITRPLLMLMALLPKTPAAVLSFVLFAGLYAGCARHVSRIFLNPSAQARWPAAAISLVLVAPYLWSDLTAGNLTSVLLASVTGAFVLEKRGRPWLAGMALSIGILLKIIPVLCLLYFLVRRRWRVAWGVAAGILLIGVLPSLAIFGPRKLCDYHGYWYRTQFSEFTPLNTIDRPIECTYQNQAVVRTMVRLFTHTNAGSSSRPFYITIAQPPRIVLKLGYGIIMAASGLALLIRLWRTRKEHESSIARADYALCVGSMLWFSPWIGSYYYTLALWPAAALLGNILTHVDDPVPRHPARRTLLLWLIAMPAIASRFLRACGIHTLAAALLLLVLTRVYQSKTRTHHPA
ncbi:MAG: glycosyltransferase family 87 protein [Phycisphaerae bacterium]